MATEPVPWNEAVNVKPFGGQNSRSRRAGSLVLALTRRPAASGIPLKLRVAFGVRQISVMVARLPLAIVASGGLTERGMGNHVGQGLRDAGAVGREHAGQG
jgi:hypothetical protein